MLNLEAPPATQTEAVFRSLRTDILRGRLLPGAKLRIDELRSRYSQGASPLREALSRLAAEGLVRAEGQRGYWVADVSLADFEDITRMRAKLEPWALQLSIENGDLAWEGDVVSAFHRMARIEQLLTDPTEDVSEQWDDTNREFHMALIARCGSPWLLNFTGMLYDRSQRYRHLSVVGGNVRYQDLNAEHNAIMDYALARKVAPACEALLQHITSRAGNVHLSLFTPKPQKKQKQA
jgi:GntR family transcriptional regulator, carbon starvation induced regulator